MSNKSLLISGAGFTAAFWVQLEKEAHKRGLSGEQIYNALKEGAPFFERFVDFMADTIQKAEASNALLARGDLNHGWWRVHGLLKKQGLRPATSGELLGPGFMPALVVKYPEIITERLRIIALGSRVDFDNNLRWGRPSWRWEPQENEYEEWIGEESTYVKGNDRFVAFPL